MRFLTFLVIGLLIVDVASSQTIVTSRTPSAAPPPKYQPVLLGKGPNSLVDQIDTAALLAKGQKDAAVMFYSITDKTGKTVWNETYRGTTGSKLLEQEVQKRLETAKFSPAIYDYKPVDAVYYGTVTFRVVNGKPRLRIFANQEAEELKKESDFVGPQPFVGRESKFEGLHYPNDVIEVEVPGLVELAMKVDAEGNLKELRVVSEDPPLVGFRRAASEDFRVAR